MLANDSFHIAVIGGDGIGPEVMAPALEVLRKVEATTPGLKFRFSETPAGAGHYRDTGQSMPDSTIKLCRDADAILLGACGLPKCAIRTAPRSCRRSSCASSSTSMPACARRGWCPACRARSSAPTRHGIDLVLIRESDRRAVRLDGQRRGHPRRGARDACHHPQDLAAAVRLFLPSRRTPQGARPARQAHLRRQGQCVQGLCLLPPDFRRDRHALSRASRPNGSMSTPARRCWCAGRGISTSW